MLDQTPHQTSPFGDLANGQRDARQVRLAAQRIVSDAQHLAEGAKQDFLVRVEARQPHAVNAHAAIHGAARTLQGPALHLRVGQVTTASSADVARRLHGGA